MLVGSDTSPITSLIQIHRVHILPDLFSSILVPPAVYQELRRCHSEIPAFVQIRQVSDEAKVASLLETLDRGEAEAIVLALESKADRLLIDELPGRSIAMQMGVPIIGLVGALIVARRQGLIASLSECPH